MQIPYQPFPTERPIERTPTGGLSVSTPPAAFGENIAQALYRVGAAQEQFGKIEAHVGDELFTRALALQNLRNETEAKEADAQYMIKAGELHAAYSTLEGKHAVDGFPKYQADLQEARQGIREGLSNDAARRFFDSSALSTMSRSIFNGAGHAATENKKYALGASSARIEASQDSVYSSPDKVTRDESLATVEHEIRHQADIYGWDHDKTEEAVRKGKSSTLAHYITGLAKNEPFKAGEVLKDNQVNLRPEDYQKVEATVNTQRRGAGARNIADEILDPIRQGDPKRPEQTLDELLKTADKKAQALAPDDPVMKDYVRQRVHQGWNEHKASVADADQRNVSTIESAFIPKNGVVPKNLDELKAVDPKVGQAWDALEPGKQRHYLDVLTKIGKPDYTPAGRTAYMNTAEGLGRYQELLGKAHNDPAGFAKVSMVEERFPVGTIQSLMAKQQAVGAGKLTTNQDVNNAMAYFRHTAGSEMSNLGIYDRKHDEQAYDQFVGAVTQAVDMYRETHNNKPPDDKALNGIYSQLVQAAARKPDFMEQIFGPSPYKGSEGGEPLFRTLTPDADFIAKVKAQMPDAPESQINRLYLREQLKKHFQQAQPNE